MSALSQAREVYSSLAGTQRVPVTDASVVGEARRVATQAATLLGLDETDTGRVAIIATELANNMVRHAQAGDLIIRPLVRGGNKGLEILALDSGRGMAEVGRCLVDGYSTAGTAGTGLGAIKRLADVFDIHSEVDHGTVVLAQVWHEGRPAADRFVVGAVAIPMGNEEVSGDAWAAVHLPGTDIFMVVDGLGHGPIAADAARVAVDVLFRHSSGPVDEILSLIHGEMKKTRGAAAALARIEQQNGSIEFAGIGNISAHVWSPGSSQNLVSHNGTLGGEVRRFQKFTYAWSDRSVLVMHSDGLATHWRTDASTAVIARHPSVSAGALFRSYARGRDDATILVAKYMGS